MVVSVALVALCFVDGWLLSFWIGHKGQPKLVNLPSDGKFHHKTASKISDDTFLRYLRFWYDSTSFYCVEKRNSITMEIPDFHNNTLLW
jgi:hypothetical protein